MTNCQHKFKMYEGFTDRYEYCETCGAKKSELGFIDATHNQISKVFKEIYGVNPSSYDIWAGTTVPYPAAQHNEIQNQINQLTSKIADNMASFSLPRLIVTDVNKEAGVVTVKSDDFPAEECPHGTYRYWRRENGVVHYSHDKESWAGSQPPEYRASYTYTDEDDDCIPYSWGRVVQVDMSAKTIILSLNELEDLQRYWPLLGKSVQIDIEQDDEE